MTANEYQKEALKYLIPKEFYIQRVPDAVIALYAALGAITNPNENISSVKLLEGTMGLVGEAGLPMIKEEYFLNNSFKFCIKKLEE